MKNILSKPTIINSLYNEKYLAAVFGILFVLSLLPLFAIAFYSHPAGDDLHYGAKTRAVYMDTHEAAAVLATAFATVGEVYYTWQGRFSDTFLCTLNPAVFGESFYPVTAFVMLFMLTASTVFLLLTVIKEILGLEGRYVVLVGVPVLFFSIQSLPSPAQGFFNHNGSVCYTFFYSLMLLLLGICLRLYYRDGNPPPAIGAAHPRSKPFWLKAILAAMLCFLISGGNFVTALVSVLIITVFVLSCFVRRRPRGVKILFIVLLLLLLTGFLISVLAPGNAVREALYEQSGMITILVKSIYYACHYIAIWLDLRIMAALLFLSPIFCKMARKTCCSFKYPLLVALFSFCLIALHFAPTVYAFGGAGADRVNNIIYFAFVLLFFMNGFYVVGYMQRTLSGQKIHLSQDFLATCVYAAAVFAVVFVLASGGRIKEHSSFIAARDLLNGTAKQYSLEMQGYYKILHDRSIKQAELPPLSATPELLCFDNITDNENSHSNRAAARFYQKEYVVVK
jgi:hypothetical protein